jgi:hypothetical protein
MSIRRTSCKNCGTPFHGSISSVDCDVCCANDWLWTCDRHGPLMEAFPAPHACPRCGYVFRSKTYTNKIALASAFAANWPDAVQAVDEQPLGVWVREVLNMGAAADLLERFAAESALDKDQRLSAMLLVLNPDGPLYWNGKACDEATLATNPEMAISLLESPLPDCCTHARTHLWLPTLAQKRQTLRNAYRELSTVPLAEPSPAGLITLVLNAPSSTCSSDALALALMRTAMRIRNFSDALVVRRRAPSPLGINMPPAPRPRRETLGSLVKPARLFARPSPSPLVPVLPDVSAPPQKNFPPTRPTTSADSTRSYKHGSRLPKVMLKTVTAAARYVERMAKNAWRRCKTWLLR